MAKKENGNFYLCVDTANSFFEAACICYDKHIEKAWNSSHLYTFATNLALAAELYIKGLMIFSSPNCEFEQGHDLSLLFNHLPEELKNEIIYSYYDTKYKRSSFEEMIEEHKRTFMDWRYLFSKTGTFRINSTDFPAFVRGLKEACNTRIPTQTGKEESIHDPVG